MATEAAGQVSALMTLLDGCLLQSVSAKETLRAAHCERIFLYCLAWAFGGSLDVIDRPAFDTELCMLSQAVPPKASCSTLAVGSHALHASTRNAHTMQELAHNASCCTPPSEALKVPARVSPEGACLQEGSFIIACGGTVLLKLLTHCTSRRALQAFSFAQLLLIANILLVCLQTEEANTIFEFLVRDDTAQWQHWNGCVPSWEYPKMQERPPVAHQLFSTLDRVRHERLLMLCYSAQKVRC